MNQGREKRSTEIYVGESESEEEGKGEGEEQKEAVDVERHFCDE